jgi:hypothetical protein
VEDGERAGTRYGKGLLLDDDTGAAVPPRYRNFGVNAALAEEGKGCGCQSNALIGTARSICQTLTRPGYIAMAPWSNAPGTPLAYTEFSTTYIRRSRRPDLHFHGRPHQGGRF